MGTRRDKPIVFGTKRNALDESVSVRVCSICGQKYVYPKGSRRPGCGRCQPTLFDNAA